MHQLGREERVGLDIPSEMDIVDTFTHLIFGGGEGLSVEEASILRALRLVDEQADAAAGRASAGGVGDYLKGLGVKEMIELVAKVRGFYLLQAPPQARRQSPDARHQPSRL